MNNSANTFYNSISYLYPVVDLFLKKHKKALIKEVNKEAPGLVLEIGVGNGSHLPLYTSHRITAIDISEAMLSRARRFENSHIKLLVMDGENLSFPEAGFDYVVMSHVLAVTNRPDQLLDQVYKVLKPEGKVFILNHFTPDNLLSYLDKGFQPFSSFLHFRSLFYMHNIKGLQRFRLIKRQNLGICSYFKLVILSKP